MTNGGEKVGRKVGCCLVPNGEDDRIVGEEVRCCLIGLPWLVERSKLRHVLCRVVKLCDRSFWLHHSNGCGKESGASSGGAGSGGRNAGSRRWRWQGDKEWVRKQMGPCQGGQLAVEEKMPGAWGAQGQV
jgi:hypothetical protein